MKKPILTCSNVFTATGLKKTFVVFAVLFFSMLFLSVMPFTVSGQAPVITYSSPKSYMEGTAITALGPTSGGVAAPVYSGPVTLLSNYNPSGLAVDNAGNVFIANGTTGIISKIPAGGGSPVKVSTFNNPVGLATDAAGDLFVETAGSNYASVYKIPAGGGPAILLSTNLIDVSYNLAADAQGNVYLGYSYSVIKIPAGGGSLVYIPSGIAYASGIAVDATGNIYVGDGINQLVNKIPAGGGAPVTIASNPSPFYFDSYALAVDKSGNLFIAGGNRVSMIPAAGGYPIPISSALFSTIAIAADGNSNIYIEDNYVLAVKEIKSFGAYAIRPDLPAGLNLDITSGIITGTPTVASPATNYTVATYISSGADSAVVNIKVLSNNANLTNLAISDGILDPAFATGTFNYTDGVLNIVKSVTVTPTVSDPTAIVTVNGVTVASGSASVPITLIPGSNVITTKVTAQDGITTKTYTTTVTQHPPSSDDNLSNIGISPGYLDQVFYAGTSNYTASENYSTTAIKVTPATEDINATVKINGTNLQAGSASINVPLKIGLNTITATVTAEDGITSKSYAIKVNRAASSNPYLSNLTFSNVVLDPAFLGSANLSTYVYSGTTSTTVTATAEDSTSTITVNGMPAISGMPSGPVALNPGLNVVTIVVTAGNGTIQKTYLVNITKRLTSGIIYVLLNNLTISSGAFMPPFVQYTPNYVVSVGTATTSISVTPTSPDARDTVKVNGIVVQSGSASGAIPLNIGPNIVTVYVAAPYDYNTITYTIIVTRTSTANAALANLTINSGTLTPAFTAGTTAYTALVGNDVTTVTLTPTTSDPLATVKVNGSVVSSGSPSAAIPLIIGTNTITTVITAADGVTTKTYTTTVTRAPSSNAYLTNLYISSNTNGAQLSPSFGNGQNYSITLTNAISSLTVTAAAYSSAATITVNGINTPLGTPSANIPLIVGDNTITVIVTAQDGITKQTYTIVVTRLPLNPSTNSSLSALAFSRGTLSPAFTTGTTSYVLNVMLSDGQLSFTPTAAGPGATITFNGQKVASGSACQIYYIYNGGVIPVKVTAQDGVTTTTYAITINILPSANANLINLVLSNGILTPAFALSNTNYTASVSNSINFIDVTPTTNNSSATIQINGLNIASSSESPDLPLSVGLNNITTVVTAQDGITKKTYTVVVNRLPLNPSSNSSLAGLTLSSGTLSPVFATGITTYTALVNSVSSLTVTPVTGDVNATVQVNGASVNSGSASAGIPLVQGANTISTVVTSPDGISKTTYTVTVTLAPSANANLIKLALSIGTLTPAFAIATGTYTAAVSNATTSVTVTPTTNNSAATVQINGITVASGMSSPSLPLAVGKNTITTIVTAQNGVTTKTYAVTVIRYPSSPSTNSSLSGLSLSSGTLSPAFNSGVTSYSSSVKSITSVNIKPTTSDGIATVTVNGLTVPNGTASPGIPLAAGPNSINTVVTAQDGVTTTTYTVIITMIPSNNAYLTSLQPSSGTLSPVFDPLTMSYTASVSNATTSITVTPVKNNNESVVTIDGALVAQSTPSASLPLAVGSNTVTAVVTAQDGVSRNVYTINVTRLSAQPDDYLTGLTLSSGTLSPAFTNSQYAYGVTINSLTSITVTPTAIDGNATIKVNGVAVTSGTVSQNIPLTPGPNHVGIIVKAQNGIDSTLYSLIVTMTPSHDATLADLEAGYYPLSPNFDPQTTSYTDSVFYSTYQTGISAVPNSSYATITYSSPDYVDPSGVVFLQFGDNEVSIIVTAQDGTTMNYNVDIIRPFIDPNIALKGIRTPADTVADGLRVHPALSPNGDGINDYLVIDKITDYPDNNLKIMDRNGVLVFEARGYDNASRVFDGHSSKTGIKQQPGTYFYSLQYKAGNKNMYKTGYLVIKY